MNAITKDYRNLVTWGVVAIVAGIFSAGLAFRSAQLGLPALVGGVFILGGLVLIVQARQRRFGFHKLIAEGVKAPVWISVHNSGAGNSSATTFIVKIYLSKSAEQSTIAFPTEERTNLRTIMETKQRAEAQLLQHPEVRGLLILYLGEQLILPNGRARRTR